VCVWEREREREREREAEYACIPNFPMSSATDLHFKDQIMSIQKCQWIPKQSETLGKET